MVVTPDGGAITSDAGVLLVQRVDRHLGLTQALACCLHDPREPRKVHHTMHTLLRQRVYQISRGMKMPMTPRSFVSIRR